MEESDGSVDAHLLGDGYRSGRDNDNRASKPARFYYLSCSVFFLALVLCSMISLGTFGVVQRDLSKFVSKLPENVNHNSCILFARYGGKVDGKDKIHLSEQGSCVFTLWSQVSLVLVSFFWLVYFLVLFGLGRPKM